MSMDIDRDKSQSGNALFLILIAVALFAALAYAVTTSGRGSGTIDKEQDALYAASLIQVGGAVRTSIQRVSLTEIPVASIVTNTPALNGGAGGGTLNGQADFCTSGSTCLFAPEGGGMDTPKPPRDAFLSSPTALMVTWGLTNYFAGSGSFVGAVFSGLSPSAGPSGWSIQGIGTAAADDMLQFYPLKKGVCLAMNKALGITGIPSIGSTASPVVATAGEPSACVDWGDGETYIYYQVVSEN